MLKALAYNHADNKTMTTEGIEGFTIDQIVQDLRKTASFFPDVIHIIDTGTQSAAPRETYTRGVDFN